MTSVMPSNIRDFPTMAEEMADLEANWPLASQIELPADATVLVVGAYKGKVMEWLLNKFIDVKHVIGFEPQKWAYDLALARLSPYEDKFTLMPWGLYAPNDEGAAERLPMYNFETDACTMVRPPAYGMSPRAPGEGEFRDALTELTQNYGLQELPNGIDLCIMNIEGYEYDLLPHLLFNDVDINSYAVQFHHDVAYDFKVFDTITEMTLRYGSPFFNMYPSWVYWKR